MLKQRTGQKLTLPCYLWFVFTGPTNTGSGRELFPVIIAESYVLVDTAETQLFLWLISQFGGNVFLLWVMTFC